MLFSWIRKKGPYFQQVLLSYGLVVGLPVLALCVLFYSCGVRQVRQEVYNGQDTLTARLMSNVAQRFEDAQAVTQAMEEDEALLSLATGNEEGLPRLTDALRYNRIFDDLLLISNEACWSAQAAQQIVPGERFSFSARDQAYFNTYVTERKSRMAYFPSANAVMWVCPLAQPRCALVGVLNRALLWAACTVEDSDALRYGAVVLTDQQQQTTLTVDMGGLLAMGDLAKLRGAGSCTLFSRRLEAWGWTVTVALPNSYLDARLHTSRLLLAVILLLSAGLVVAVSNHQYRPIQNLSSLAGRAADQEEDFSANELDSIGTALAAGNQLTRQATYQKTVLRENLILRLVNGAFTQEDDIFTTLNSMDMFAGAKECRVVALRHPGGAARVSHEALMSYIDVRYSRRDRAYAVETEAEDQSLVLMLLKLPLTGQEAYTDQLIADLQLFIDHRMQARFLYGVGNPHPLTHIPTSYLEAMAALEHCPDDGGGPVVRFDALQSDHLLEAQYNQAYQKNVLLFVHSLRAANGAVAWPLLDALEKEYADRPTWRYSAFRLTEAVMQMVMDRQNDRYRLDEAFPALSAQLNLALAASAWEEHQQLMGEITRLILGMGERWNQRKENAAREQLSQWMQAHICDPGLSLDLLSDTFGFSTPYWSRFFTEQMGVGFNDWVWQSRLSLVKERLTRTDTPIRQIVQEVGYTDVSSFSRRFKAEEGVPPGQYRAAARG